jgi:hypothetical protein
MNFTQTPDKYFDNQYLFEVIGKWSELKITDKCCKKIPLFVVNYNDEKIWLICNEHFKKTEFRKHIREVILIENISEL